MSLDVAEKFCGANVLITGGLGFIGSNLARTLVEAGAQVTLLDALLEPYGGNTVNVDDIKNQLEIVDGNIMDEQLVQQQVTGKDYIFHLAGQVGYLDSKERPFEDLDFNGRGNLILLEAVKAQAPQVKIVFSSSRLVYGKILQTPVTEAHSTEPLSLYAIHKLLAEKHYAYYAHNFGVQGVSLRIPNPYGPRQQMKHARYGIVGWFLRQAMEDQPITIYGDGKQLRDYVYIDDIISAMLAAAVSGQAGEAYNIGSGEELTFEQMVDAIIAQVGSGHKEFVSWPEDYEKNETGDYLADFGKLTTATGWQPTVAFSDGIAKMHSFYEQHRAAYW